jgi:chromatin remodeling complex protein RSC6
MKLSADLAAIVGKRVASKAECIKLLLTYLKQQNLQDPTNKHYFTPDDKMAKVFGKEKMHAFSMSRHIGPHLSPMSGTTSYDCTI